MSSTNPNYTENVAPVVPDLATLRRLLHAVYYTPGRKGSDGVHDPIARGISAAQDAAWLADQPASQTDDAVERHRLRVQASKIVWGIPVLLLGPPGCGKTQIVESGATAAGFRAVTLVASQRQPEDVAGFPIPDHELGSVRRMPDTWLDELTRDARDGSVLILDELSTADESMMAAFLRVLSDRAAGDRALPNRTRIVAAGNRAGEAPNVRTLAPADANRFIHLTYTGPTSEEWADWVLQDLDQESDILDPNVEEARVLRAWPAAMSAAKAQIARYIGSIAPGALHAMGSGGNTALRADHPQSSGPWASHRTWEMAIRLLASSTVHNLSRGDRDLLLCAVLGTTADGLITWLKKQDLPDLAELVSTKGKYTNDKGKLVEWRHSDKRLDLTYTVVNGLAGLMRDRINAGVPAATMRDQVDWVAGLLLKVQDQDPDTCVQATRLLYASGVSFVGAPTPKHPELVFAADSPVYKLMISMGRYMEAVDQATRP